LYFLGKGKFMVHKTSADAKQYHIMGGDIYARGWLNPDLSVAGEIIITSDEKYSETFSFKATRPEK
jgi:aspartyl aminopeptidase